MKKATTLLVTLCAVLALAACVTTPVVDPSTGQPIRDAAGNPILVKQFDWASFMQASAIIKPYVDEWTAAQAEKAKAKAAGDAAKADAQQKLQAELVTKITDALAAQKPAIREALKGIVIPAPVLKPEAGG